MPATSHLGLLPPDFSGVMTSMGYFEPKPVVAVATSGGADSMALLLLAHEWVQAYGGSVISLTVNHHLRFESTNEATQVRAWCDKLAIKHEILDWHPEDNISAIQESARNARYHLLTEYCKQNNILHLITAHHMGDQAETLFFRLARGSGIDGLSAMSTQTAINGIRLLRPLLYYTKEQLIKVLKDRGQDWIEDPSNNNNKYSRVYIRGQLNHALIEKSNNLAYDFSRIRNAQDSYLVRWLTEYVHIYHAGYAVITTKDIPIIALAKIITSLNGNAHPPRGKKLETLRHNLDRKNCLAGLIFEPLKKHLLIYREENNIEPARTIHHSQSLLWDNRFIIRSSAGYCVKALGSDGLKLVKKLAPQRLKNMPADRILRTIPSLWHLEELLAVPHIAYMSKEATEQNIPCNIMFKPAKPLAGSCFFVNNQT